MRRKKILAVILLVASFCFVSGVGYGEIPEWVFKVKVDNMKFALLAARVDYMMAKPDSFLGVSCYYDSVGDWAEFFPAGVSTKGKVVISVLDNRGVFDDKTGELLLDYFKKELNFIYVSIFRHMPIDINNDIIVEFMDNFGEPLGYFSEGEYHLWEE